MSGRDENTDGNGSRLSRRSFSIITGGYVGFTILYVGRELWQTQRDQMEEASEYADEKYGEGNWHWECGRVCRTVPNQEMDFTFTIVRGRSPPCRFAPHLSVEFQTHVNDGWHAQNTVTGLEWGDSFVIELEREKRYRILVIPSKGDPRAVGLFDPERESPETQITIDT